MFKRIGIVALLACVAYVVYKEFFEEDSTETNNDTVEYVDADEVSNTEPEDPNTFIQPEFDNSIDISIARELICRAIEHNGYVTTTYIMHVASVVKGDTDKPMLNDHIDHHADPNMGYTDVNDFKGATYDAYTGMFILTSKPPKNIKEYVKNGSRQEVD